jgi:ATP-binding cassette, subfamily B, bacterial
MTVLVLLGLGLLAPPIAAAICGLWLTRRIAASFERPVPETDGAELGIRAVAKRHKGAIGVLMSLGLLESLLSLASPWPLKVVVDSALGKRPLPFPLHPLHSLGRPGLAVAMGLAGVALVAELGAVGYAGVLLSVSVSQSISASLQNGLVGRLLRLPLRFHERARRGDLVSRLTSDVTYVQESMLAKVEVVVPKIITVASMTLLMLVLSPMLALVVLGAVPALALIGTVRRRAVANVQRKTRASSGNLASVASELLGNVRVVQSFGQESAEARRFDRATRELALASVGSARARARLSPGADLVLAIDLAVVMVLGTAQVAAHQLSLGVLFVFLAYLATLEEPVRALSRLASTLGRGAASAERISELLAEQPVSDIGRLERTETTAPTVVVEGVSFAYQPGAAVLRDVTFEVTSGETVCVMGPSGVGKSTLLSLLVRLHDPDVGRVLIGGIDARDLSLRSLHEQVALVPQEAWLVRGTIAENIAYGAPGSTVDEVQEAGRLATVDEFADRLPNGWASEVGEGGLSLSGGQRRRVAIARAIIGKRPLLLLDEPTAGLDPSAKRQVIDAVRSAAQGRTVIIVTHDQELAKVANSIISLGHEEGVDQWSSAVPSTCDAR